MVGNDVGVGLKLFKVLEEFIFDENKLVVLLIFVVVILLLFKLMLLSLYILFDGK